MFIGSAIVPPCCWIKNLPEFITLGFTIDDGDEVETSAFK